jgi:hypothetical protein
MKMLGAFWRRPRPAGAKEVAPLSDELLRPIALSALADLERNLDIWAARERKRDGSEPSKELAVVGQRVEKELQRFFGHEVLQRLSSTAGESVNGRGILFADRLFVAFLGRSAAMAVTRKLYSRLT